MRPSPASVRISVRTQRMPSGSSPLTGSSNSSTGGSPSSAAAMPSRWLMPSDSVPAFLAATAVSPTMSSTSSTRPAGSRCVAAIQRRCARTDRLGWVCLASSSAPTCRSGSASSRYGLPSMVAVPDVGWSSPRIIRIVVVLPAPLGPRNPVTTPGSMVQVRSSTARVRPNTLVSPANSIIVPILSPRDVIRLHRGRGGLGRVRGGRAVGLGVLGAGVVDRSRRVGSDASAVRAPLAGYPAMGHLGRLGLRHRTGAGSQQPPPHTARAAGCSAEPAR